MRIALPFHLGTASAHLIEELKRVYVGMYPQCSRFLFGTSENFPHTCRKYEYVLINGRKLSSTENSLVCNGKTDFPISLLFWTATDR